MTTTPVTRADALAILATDRLAATTVRSLNEAGVRVLLLKGAGLARWLYPEGTIRPSQDVDLLIDPVHLQTAEAVLRTLGWEHPWYPLPHAREWRKPGVPLTIDLHHSFHFVTVPDDWCWELLSEGAEPMTLAGETVLVPSAAVMATLLALHALSEGAGQRTWDELERALALGDEFLWRHASELARALGALEAFTASLRCCGAGVLLAESLGLPKKRGKSQAIREKTFRTTTGGFVQLNDAAGFAELFKLSIRELVPGPEHMRWRYPRLAGKGPAVLALAYVLRPIGLLVQAPRGWREWRSLRREQERLRSGEGQLDLVALAIEVVTESIRARAALRRRRVARALEVARRQPSARNRRPAVTRGGSASSIFVRDAEVSTGRKLSSVNERVMEHLPGDTRCLIRCLVLTRLLSTRGIDSKVVLAVRRSPPVAHAWVEVHGEPISPLAADNLVRLAEL